MLKIDDKAITATLPSSINHDEQVLAAANAIEERLREVSFKADLLLLLPRLDELSEALVDELAWQYHVDFYDHKADIIKKRALVKNAIAWHRYKGTPAAVEEVCSAAFKTAAVFENWEYGGEPYHFQVRLIEEGIPDQSVIDALIRAINDTKNVRSWLDGLCFYREIFGDIYLGAMVAPQKTVSIFPAKFTIPNLQQRSYLSAIMAPQKTVSIFPAPFKMQDLKMREYVGGGYEINRKVDLKCQTGMV